LQPIRCGVTNVPLNLEHVIPRARGGSNRPSNLVLACIPCNTEKGSQTIEEFLASNPALLACVKAQIAAPLKDAAAANATRNAPYETGRGVVQGINHKHFKILQRVDGYGYAVSASSVRHCVPTAFFPRLKAGVSSGES
jgi:HNH endonuclease